MANCVDQTPIGAVCSGSTLFASILNSSVMLGNYLLFFSKLTFSKDFFSGPDLGPKSLQRLSLNDTSRQSSLFPCYWRLLSSAENL